MNAFNKNLALWIVIVLMMIMLYNIFSTQQQTENEIGYSQFLTMVDNGRVDSVTIQGDKLSVTDETGDTSLVYAPQDN